MNEKEEKKENQSIPTCAPTDEEIARAEGGVPTTPEDYPLFKKLDALIEGQKRVADTLEKIAEKLSPTIVGANAKPIGPAVKAVESPEKSTSAPAKQPTTEPKASKLEEVKMAFPEDLEVLMAFSEKDGYILIKPRQFLGSENFAKIASAVRGLGGEYISAGKESHFRVKA